MNKKKQRSRPTSGRDRHGVLALLDVNRGLRKELLHAQKECEELRDACANLVIERDAADALLREVEVGGPR
jgi:hypothetical protein